MKNQKITADSFESPIRKAFAEGLVKVPELRTVTTSMVARALSTSSGITTLSQYGRKEQ